VLLPFALRSQRTMRVFVAASLSVIAVATAARLGRRAQNWNDELELVSPLASVEPIVIDPDTPRLTDAVVLIVIDGLGIDESHLAFLDELRAHGVAEVAEVPYPTISRPNYVTILAGVPPADSGVRANRVRIPVAVDTAMDRVRAGGMRVATASDFGIMPNLFARGARTLGAIRWIEHGSHISAPPGITWPIDEAERAPSVPALAPVIGRMAASSAFVPVLVLDVDRAGHAHGVGAEYRAAAADVDRMVRAAVAKLDLGRTTVIVTADHGHVAPGGHGGPEREVAHVPLILAGKGIRSGAHARAHTIDVAPTICALLGVPSPGHAEGHALTELLELAPEQAARREAADAARDVVIAQILDVARAAQPRPVPWRLGVLALAVVVALAIARELARRGAFARTRSPVGLVGFGVMLVAMVAVTRGHASPSYVPSLAKTTELAMIGVVVAVILQVIASWWAIRRAPDRVAAASSIVALGLGTALVVRFAIRAWFTAPFIVVPSPLWIVAVPTIELATATCAIAGAITLVLALLRPRA
jgi:hypothetical protein